LSPLLAPLPGFATGRFAWLAGPEERQQVFQMGAPTGPVVAAGQFLKKASAAASVKLFN
jgi:hypothetical protein